MIEYTSIQISRENRERISKLQRYGITANMVVEDALDAFDVRESVKRKIKEKGDK